MDDGRYSYQIQYSSHDSLILYCRPQPHIRVSLTPVSWQTMQNPMRSLCQELPVQIGGLANQLPQTVPFRWRRSFFENVCHGRTEDPAPSSLPTRLRVPLQR